MVAVLVVVVVVVVVVVPPLMVVVVVVVAVVVLVVVVVAIVIVVIVRPLRRGTTAAPRSHAQSMQKHRGAARHSDPERLAASNRARANVVVDFVNADSSTLRLATNCSGGGLGYGRCLQWDFPENWIFCLQPTLNQIMPFVDRLTMDNTKRWTLKVTTMAAFAALETYRHAAELKLHNTGFFPCVGQTWGDEGPAETR